MKISIFSHCTIDTIDLLEKTYDQPGGAACYCGLTLTNFNCNANIFTKFGADFPKELLCNKKIKLTDELSELPSTRFKIKISGTEREIFLENTCEPIDYVSSDSDGVIITPVFHELSIPTFEKIKRDNDFIFLDPQGFLRQVNAEKKIYLEKTDLDLTKISAIKTSPDELYSLTGSEGIDGMKILQKKGVEHVIFTNKQQITLLVKDKTYHISLPKINLFDTTGIGDIFCTTFCYTMIKEKDFFWSLSFAGGAAQAALESNEIGLNKIPKRGAIETNAAYFYNQIKFKQV